MANGSSQAREVWFNDGGGGYPISTTFGSDVTNSGGNIDADSQFARNPNSDPDTTWFTADDDYSDLRLRSGSPAIDVGGNSAVPASITGTPPIREHGGLRGV